MRARTISFNKSIVYSRVPFPTFDATTGSDNFNREYTVGGESIGIAGFKINGKFFDPKLLLESKEVKNKSVNDALDILTKDEALLNWARYNAHLNGPIVCCSNNIVKLLQNLGATVSCEDGKQRNVIDLGQVGKESTFHLYQHFTATGEPEENTLYFSITFSYRKIVLESLEEDKDLPVIEALPTSPIPLMAFSATIKAQKLSDGRIITTLEEEALSCFDSRAEPYFAILEKQVTDRLKLESFMQDIAINITNFASTVNGYSAFLPSTSTAAAAAATCSMSSDEAASFLQGNDTASAAQASDPIATLSRLATIDTDIDNIIIILQTQIEAIIEKTCAIKDDIAVAALLDNQKQFNKLFELLWVLRQQLELKEDKTSTEIKFITVLDTLFTTWAPIFLEKTRAPVEGKAPASSLFRSVSSLLFSSANKPVPAEPVKLTSALLERRNKVLQDHVTKLTNCTSELKNCTAELENRIKELPAFPPNQQESKAIRIADLEAKIKRLTEKRSRLEEKIVKDDIKLIEFMREVYDIEHAKPVARRKMK